MPTATTIARPPARASDRGGDIISLFVATSMAAALLIAVSSLLVDHDRVTMTLDNPSEYEISVAVRTPHEGTLTRLGTLGPGSTRTVTGVIDPGDEWHFEFSYAGVDGGMLTVPAEIGAAGPIVVPEHVSERLAEAGLERSPG